MNETNSLSKNPEMGLLKQNLLGEFPDINFLKEGPASKPDDQKTDVIGKVDNFYIKGFTQTGKVLGIVEHRLIELFNQFSRENSSRFSGPTIFEEGNTKDGGYFFRMEDAKKYGKEELDFSKMEADEIMKLYNEYRQTFDEFEKFSKGKISTESNPTLQKIYALSNKYRDNILFNLVGNPVLKTAVGKMYKNKINGRISNGEGNVKTCGIEVDREKINKSFDKLLSNVKNVDFEYNFGRFWSGHVFSDGISHKFVDFDNVSYQIKGMELLGIMRSNLLISVGNYNSYEEWKFYYDKWYKRLLETHGDNNLVKFLLFIKLVGTIFEDYGNLIYKREIGDDNKLQDNETFDKIKKGIEWNYKALQELMKE